MIIERIGNAFALLGISFIAAVVVITIHEFAHAFTSWSLGDKLPKFNKRLTLNPLRHIDFVGILFLMHTGYGWGKPVETSARNYKDKVKGTILTGISGPLASIFIGMIASFALAFIGIEMEQGKLFLPGYSNTYAVLFLSDIFHFSLNIAIVSLLPVKPFDGLMIWGKLISSKSQFKIFQFQGAIVAIFLLIILISPNVFAVITQPIASLLQISAKGIVKLIL